MNHVQIENDIAVIKQMIEKTRRETAESGHFFIFLGAATIVFVFVIGMLELLQLNRWIIPTMIALTALNGFIGFIAVRKSLASEKVKTYTKTIMLNLWAVCGFAMILITFFFPFIDVYPLSALGVIASVFLGIAVFMTGVIYEMQAIKWLSSTWLLSAALLGAMKSQYNFLILIAAILVGWILPGLVIQRKYNRRNN